MSRKPGRQSTYRYRKHFAMIIRQGNVSTFRQIYNSRSLENKIVGLTILHLPRPSNTDSKKNLDKIARIKNNIERIERIQVAYRVVGFYWEERVSEAEIGGHRRPIQSKGIFAQKTSQPECHDLEAKKKQLEYLLGQVEKREQLQQLQQQQDNPVSPTNL